MYSICKNYNPQASIDPYRGLICAIAERAFMDLLGNNKLDYLSAYEWFFVPSIKPKDSPYFTFSEICEVLELNEILLLKQIRVILDKKEDPDFLQEIENKKSYIRSLGRVLPRQHGISKMLRLLTEL